MLKWRYKTLVIRELALCESKLNAEGEKGWELTSVCIHADGTTARAFLKQPAGIVEETDSALLSSAAGDTSSPVPA